MGCRTEIVDLRLRERGEGGHTDNQCEQSSGESECAGMATRFGDRLAIQAIGRMAFT